MTFPSSRERPRDVAVAISRSDVMSDEPVGHRGSKKSRFFSSDLMKTQKPQDCGTSSRYQIPPFEKDSAGNDNQEANLESHYWDDQQKIPLFSESKNGGMPKKIARDLPQSKLEKCTTFTMGFGRTQWCVSIL